MASEPHNSESDGKEGPRIEFGKLKVSGKKVAEVLKGAAVTYVGFQLGVLALKFIGRRLGIGKPRQNLRPTNQQRPQAVVRPSAQQGVTLTEDTWSVVDAPAPDTPAGYKAIVDAVLPCSPQELYGILFSGPGTSLYLKQHEEIGKQWDLVATGWRRAPGKAVAYDAASAGGRGGDGAAGDSSLLGPQTVFEYVVGQPAPGGFTRLLTFWNPKKPPSTVDTRCVQRQQFCVYRGGVLVFATAMNMLDIPFKDCFTVNTFWRVAPGPQPGTCALTINLKVNFVKRAMGVGGIISATTFRDSAAFFTAFTANVDAHVRALRDQAGAQLPAPLPTVVPLAGAAPSAAAAAVLPQQPGGAQGARSPPSRAHLVSPFAAASGAGEAAAAAAQQRQAIPAWRQVRALLVVALLAFTLLNQLHLGRELAALRTGGAAGGDGAAAAGEGPGLGDNLGGNLVAQAGGLLAAALGPVATATGSLHLLLQALVDRVGGRAPQVPPPGL